MRAIRMQVKIFWSLLRSGSLQLRFFEASGLLGCVCKLSGRTLGRFASIAVTIETKTSDRSKVSTSSIVNR